MTPPYLKTTFTSILCLLLSCFYYGQQLSVPNGSIQELKVTDDRGEEIVLPLRKIQVLSEEMQQRYPDLHSYTIDAAGMSGVVTVGMGALIGEVNDGRQRYQLQDAHFKPEVAQQLMVVVEKSTAGEKTSFTACTSETDQPPGPRKKFLHPLEDIDRLILGTVQRTYKIVIAPTYEFVKFNSRPGISPEMVIVATLARVSTIFKRDLSINLQLSGILTYGEGVTVDDFEPDGDNRLALASQVIAANFKSSDYDLGMVFDNPNLTNDFRSGGVASRGSVCGPKKGAGWVGLGDNTSDRWNWYVAHELGHMFGARHTFNGAGGSCDGGQISSSSAVEIGGGSTVMGYYDLCGDGYDVISDAGKINYFHQVSLSEIATFLTTADCAQASPSDNSPPIVEADPCEKASFKIPIGTAFELRGSATDMDNDTLSYSWEQIDEDGTSNPSQGATLTQTATIDGKTAEYSKGAPLFQNFLPTSSPVRRFPNNVEGRSTEFEVLPLVARTLRFGLAVRDNHTPTGALAVNTTEVEVISAGPLLFDGPDAGTRLTAGRAYNFTWEHNGSVSICEEVVVEMSLDGGRTYTYQLGTARYGAREARFILPASVKESDVVRFRIACDDSPCHTFFAVDPRPRQLINEACDAISSSLDEVDAVNVVSATGEANLGLSLQPGRRIDATISGTLDARKSARVKNAFLRSSASSLRCAVLDNNVSTEVHYISTSTTGEYALDIFRSSNVFLVVSVYEGSFDRENGCDNWITSNAYITDSGDALADRNRLTFRMKSGRQYLFTVATEKQSDLSSTPVNYQTYLSRVSGEGEAILTDRPVQPRGYTYTFLAVEESTDVIRDVDASANFTDLPSAAYDVYVINYPTGIDEGNWIGKSLSTVLSTGTSKECLSLSDNSRRLNVTSQLVAAPVEWLFFSGIRGDGSVQLKWSVATEVENDHFLILRSSNGFNWDKIGQVAGRGTAFDRGDYSFADTTPLSGVAYYRLTQLDYDGSSNLSSVVTVEGEVGTSGITVYPNPFSNKLTIEAGLIDLGNLTLFDLTGREVNGKVTIIKTGNKAVIGTDALPTGAYILRSGSETVKLFKH